MILPFVSCINDANATILFIRHRGLWIIKMIPDIGLETRYCNSYMTHGSRLNCHDDDDDDHDHDRAEKMYK